MLEMGSLTPAINEKTYHFITKPLKDCGVLIKEWGRYLKKWEKERERERKRGEWQMEKVKYMWLEERQDELGRLEREIYVYMDMFLALVPCICRYKKVHFSICIYFIETVQ